MEKITPLRLEDQVPNLALSFYDPRQDAIVDGDISQFLGKNRIVLFFYPADFTFVCPTELRDLQQAIDELSDVDAEIFVASTDTNFSHKRRVETEKLLAGFGIKMISDRTGEISKTFGAYNRETGNSERGTFIISPQGQLKSIEIVTEPIGRSSVELVRKIRALQFVASNPGHACPASRNLGAKTLQPSVKIAGHVGEELEK